MIPTLPRLDPDPTQRASELEAVRSELTYAWDRPAGVAMAASVPRRLGLPLGVLTRVAAAEAAILANRAAVRLREGLLHPPSDDSPTSIESATHLFAALDTPPLVSLLAHGGLTTELGDRAFAWQRVAGACPQVIARADRATAERVLDDSAFRSVMGEPLSAACAEGRVLVADYAMLDGVPAGSGNGAPKYLCAPLALFARTAGSAALVPVGIRLGQRPDAPLLTPQDGVAWQMARVAVQVADANVQESFHHLGRAHFLMEAFAMAIERRLSTRHPLYVLLSPHYHGTLAINGAARDQLVVPGGQLELLLAPTLEGSLSLVRRALSSFRLGEAGFEADLAARGVADADSLPDYPYRDDGRPIVAAIETWVSDYLSLYYALDQDVSGDLELAAMIDELRSEEGGRLGAGLPTRIETIAELESLVSFVISTASVLHASLNYTQGDFLGWCPNAPTAAYAPPPAAGSALDEDAWPAVLPRHALAEKQLEFMVQQSQVRDDRLGDYPAGHFRDPRVVEPLSRFRASLDGIARDIESRQAARLLPYPYLSPTLLTASIHI